MRAEINGKHRRYSVVMLISSIIAIYLFVFVDQIVKEMILTHYRYDEFPLIGKFIYFRYAENTGAAFSILSGWHWLLVTLPIIMIVVCLLLLFSQRIKYLHINFCLILIVSGGIGNLIDRVVRGFVVDYIDPRFITFAIFNIADCYLVVGTFMLCLFILIHEGHHHKGFLK